MFRATALVRPLVNQSSSTQRGFLLLSSATRQQNVVFRRQGFNSQVFARNASTILSTRVRLNKQHQLHSSSYNLTTSGTPEFSYNHQPNEIPWQKAWLRDIALCTGVLGFGYALYNTLKYPEQTAAVTIMDLPKPSDDFSHPLEQTSWYYQAFITTKRVAYLLMLFLPCAAVGLAAQLSNSESMRQYMMSLIVRAFESAGCGFQKFGQWISMRPDMFPREIVEAMSRLRQDVPSHSYSHTRNMIKESFGREIEEIFLEFDESPVASGTVAQVHRAILRPEFVHPGGSREVAVKVRHPSVLEETFVDLSVLFKLLDQCKFMAVPFDKDDFMKNLQRQINFEWEAYSLSRYAHDFKSEIAKGEVSFPTVNASLLSPSVLVESWAAGRTIGTYFADVGDGFKEIASTTKAVGQKLINTIEEQREIAERMFGVCMKMFLRDNHMHGDLHAGNLLYHHDSHTLTVLDAGCTTSLTRESAADFGRFMHGLCTGNTKDVVASLVSFSNRPVMNQSEFEADIDKSVKRWVAPNGRAHDGRPVCIGDLVGEILFKLHQYNVQLRGDVASSIMSIAVSEGLIRQLDPEFDMNRRALPYLAKYGFPGGTV
jgi:aarF domain-containing kinase